MKKLNIKQLKQLRNEIVLCSHYLKHYENSFMSKEEASTFFDGYADYLSELMAKNIKDYNNADYFKYVNDYDTVENLNTYYNLCLGYDSALKTFEDEY